MSVIPSLKDTFQLFQKRALNIWYMKICKPLPDKKAHKRWFKSHGECWRHLLHLWIYFTVLFVFQIHNQGFDLLYLRNTVLPFLGYRGFLSTATKTKPAVGMDTTEYNQLDAIKTIMTRLNGTPLTYSDHTVSSTNNKELLPDVKKFNSSHTTIEPNTVTQSYYDRFGRSLMETTFSPLTHHQQGTVRRHRKELRDNSLLVDAHKSSSMSSAFSDNYQVYGKGKTYVILLLRCLNLIALPLILFHFCGLVFYPAFPDPPRIYTSDITVPANNESDDKNTSFISDTSSYKHLNGNIATFSATECVYNTHTHFVQNESSLSSQSLQNKDINNDMPSGKDFDIVVVPTSCDKELSLQDNKTLGYSCSPHYPSSIHRGTKIPPFICFRVVTRGNFPALVRRNVVRNYLTCHLLGYRNFVIQVVTDNSIGLLNQHEITQQPRSYNETTKSNSNKPQIWELVVPNEYVSPRGSRFKARALQYALAPENDTFLADSDWIVHLDEETLLTRDSLVGILNFAHEGSCDFGQGLITYARNGVLNWLTTLADTFRVADDMGKLRFQLSCPVLRAPLFNLKGSFVVTRAGAERHVTFDVGPDGSIAEDCYFAMRAMYYRYKERKLYVAKPSQLCDVKSDSPTSHPTLPSTQDFSRNLRKKDSLIDNKNLLINTLSTCSLIEKKYSLLFNFIEGEMWEQSPYTISDFLKQRKRWLQGIYLVVHRCTEIPIWPVKLCLTVFVWAWILMPAIFGVELCIVTWLPLYGFPRILRIISAFISGTTIYMYAYGSIISFFRFGGRDKNYKKNDFYINSLRELNVLNEESITCHVPKHNVNEYMTIKNAVDNHDNNISTIINTEIPSILLAHDAQNTKLTENDYKNNTNNSYQVSNEKKPLEISEGINAVSLKESLYINGNDNCKARKYAFYIGDGIIEQIKMGENDKDHSDDYNSFSNNKNYNTEQIKMLEQAILIDENIIALTLTPNSQGVLPQLGKRLIQKYVKVPFNNVYRPVGKFVPHSIRSLLKHMLQTITRCTPLWIRRFVSWLKRLIYRFILLIICVTCAIAIIPFNVCIEITAVCWGLCTAKNQFYVVAKQSTS